jgi:putative YhdH/YhfP family quinone oxidoreductase
MDSKSFKALEIRETEDGSYKSHIVSKKISDLPEGDLLIKVKYSSLNYKDALSAQGNKGVTKNYPHTPGIDAAGVVEKSLSNSFNVGDEVIVTGHDLGMNTPGGFGQYISVPADWVVHLPKSLSLKESMIYGTAGFTAALSVHKIVSSGINAEDGEILVTGATGGVGTTAISILGKLGYQVIGATGKSTEEEFLKSIGASGIIDRNEVDDQSGRPMLKGRWASVIDTVGGNTLSTALKTTQYGGCVTCCGNVRGHDFQASIYPFILKGVTLFGIDSVQCPMDLRKEIWSHLADDWKYQSLNSNIQEVSLDEIRDRIDLMLDGKQVGRTILKHDA